MSKTDRGLFESFMAKLKEGGEWHCLIEQVKKDHTLILELRDNYINIYYRGCSVLKLYENGKIEIADEYLKFECENEVSTVKSWIKNIADIKQSVDTHLSENQKLEREFQQVVVRDNNRSKGANSTDYFIVDIEMTDTDINARFDMIAIKWERNKRGQKNKNCTLSIIEMKYGKDSFENFKKHIADIQKLYEDKEKLNVCINEMIDKFEDLRTLKLIDDSEHNKNQITKNDIDTDNIEFIILFANYVPASDIMDKYLDVFSEIDKKEGINLKFATSNFMGYGLYSNAMLNFDEFKELYEKRK